MGTKSRETIYGGSVRASAQRAAAARKEADKLTSDAWNKRMLAFKATGAAIADAPGPLHAVQELLAQAQPSGRASAYEDFGE